MDDQTKLAFASVSDSFKQMITLGTGVLTLEVTFLKDIIKDLPGAAYFALGSSWVFFLITLLAGIAGLLAITGTLSRCTNLNAASVYSGNIRLPGFVQVLAFFIGMLLSVVFGVILLFHKAYA